MPTIKVFWWVAICKHTQVMLFRSFMDLVHFHLQNSRKTSPTECSWRLGIDNWISRSLELAARVFGTFPVYLTGEMVPFHEVIPVKLRPYKKRKATCVSTGELDIFVR